MFVQKNSSTLSSFVSKAKIDGRFKVSLETSLPGQLQMTG